MKKVGKYIKENTVFILSVIIAFVIIIYGYLNSSQMNLISGIIMTFVSDYFGWLYLAFVLISGKIPPIT